MTRKKECNGHINTRLYVCVFVAEQFVDRFADKSDIRDSNTMYAFVCVCVCACDIHNCVCVGVSRQSAVQSALCAVDHAGIPPIGG